MKTIGSLLLSGCLFLSAALAGQSPVPYRHPDDRNFNSRNRIYLLLGANIFSLTQEGLGMNENTDPQLAPIVGGGFTLVNFSRGMSFINLEADYTRADFTLSRGGRRSASALTFMVQGEIRFSRSGKISLFTGVGFGILRLRQSSDPVLAWDFGLKASLLPRLMLRAAARFYYDARESGYEYWFDDYYDYWDEETRLTHWASSLYLALEYHF